MLAGIIGPPQISTRRWMDKWMDHRGYFGTPYTKSTMPWLYRRSVGYALGGSGSSFGITKERSNILAKTGASYNAGR